ncbi:unnamed protein product [Spirodela intermedia]|uniref:Protein kinase domain-containing protein n=1 Tax=Spirodela intermedia TaxID=51605 RepID=A0A7I8L1U8_SPIIN|nr:unnamed protein product [Spirodela intermedia]
MGAGHGIRVLFGVVSPFLAVLLLFVAMYHCRNRSCNGGRDRRRRWLGWRGRPSGEKGHGGEGDGEEEEAEAEELISFPGGEDLTVHAILDAPGEVVGKSNYSTLYKAWVGVSCSDDGGGGGGSGRRGSLMLLRFVRPACIGRTGEVLPAVQLLGFVRHPNLVPLHALYVGPRGEKLLILPFFSGGSLYHFLKDGSKESYQWELIHQVSVGIAEGLDHLHNGLPRPVVHGNLKSKNILLDDSRRPRLSDFGLHLLLNPNSGQEMLEALAAEGYKSPELMKMREASKASDIYSLGIIFLEMITRKEPSSELAPPANRRLPSSIWNPVFDGKAAEMLCPELLRRSTKEGSIKEDGLLEFFQLAMACCSPSPLLRPDIKDVRRKLADIGRLVRPPS